jgi:polyhydroxyalkanoate synthesis regulator phasin
MTLKRTLPLAVAALVIGLALGSTVFAPGAAGAQESDPTETAPADTAQERWLEHLQPLVDDGTITDEQAEAVADHLVSSLPGRHGRFIGRVPGLMLFAEAADIIGVEPGELREALAGGSTLAEVAEANDVETETLIEGLVAAIGEKLDSLVEEGEITEERAAQILENAPDRIEGFVAAGVHSRRGFWLTPARP